MNNMQKEFFKILFVLIVFQAFAACASMMGSSDQPLSVETPYCPNASCRLSNSNGTYFIKETPGTIPINKAYGDLTVVCEKDGATMTSVHSSSANGKMWANIIIGGGIGALIDSGSGAGYDYDATLINPLKCGDITTNESLAPPKESEISELKGPPIKSNIP